MMNETGSCRLTNLNIAGTPSAVYLCDLIRFP